MSFKMWWKDKELIEKHDPLDQKKQKEEAEKEDSYYKAKAHQAAQGWLTDLQEEHKGIKHALNRMESRLDVMDTQLEAMRCRNTDAIELQNILVKLLDKAGFAKYTKHEEDDDD